MVSVSTPRWRSLERWSPKAFLAAGILLVAYAALNGIAAFSETAYPTVEDVLGPGGFALGFVGLLGLYPILADRSRTVARVGAACAVFGAVGFFAISVSSLGRLVGVVPDGPSVVEPLLLGLVVVGMIPGFVAFGVASLRADCHPNTVGLLLLAPPTIFAVMLTQAILFFRFGLFSEASMAWSAFAISGGQALAYLAVGRSIRIAPSSTGRTVPSGDVTTS